MKVSAYTGTQRTHAHEQELPPGSKTQSCFLVGLPVEPELYSFLAVTQARLERQLWPTQEWIYQKRMRLRAVLVRIHLRGEERQSSLAV